MIRSKWWSFSRAQIMVAIFAVSIAFGGACNCDDDEDPRPDADINDVEDDIIDDVDEHDVDNDIIANDVVDDPVDIPDGMARIQVIHNSADPAAESVDIYFDDDLVIDDFQFRTATPFFDVDAEEYDIVVAESDSDTVDDGIATFGPIDLEEGQRYLIIASGVLDAQEFNENPDAQDTDFAFHVIDNAREVSDDPNTDRVILFHGVADAPTIDLVAENTVTVVSDLTYGNFSDGYFSLPTGITVFDLLVSDTNQRINSYQTPTLAGGDAYVALVSGFLDSTQNEDAPLEVILYPTPVDGERLEPIFLDEAARLQLIHDSPDPDTSPAALTIDTRFSADDLTFRSATSFLTFPSGEFLQVSLTDANADETDDDLFTESVQLESGSTTVGIFSGVLEPQNFPENPDGSDTELDLYLYDAARETSAEPDLADILAFHGIIDAPTIELFVDLDESDIVIDDDLNHGEFTDYTTLAAEEVVVSIGSNGPPPIPLAQFPVDITGFAGEAVTIILSGILEEDAALPVRAVIVDADGDTFIIDPED